MSLRRDDFGEVVAAAAFVFRSVNGTEKTVTVRVGKPYQISEAEWACPSEIKGHEPRYVDARGGDSMQALCLAITLLQSRIEDFLSRGGKVFHAEDASEWDARAIAATFGRIGRGQGNAE